MPRVIERVADLFGKPPLCSINPDEVVALGAAVQAGLIAKRGQSRRPGRHRRRAVLAGDRTPARLFGAEHREGYFLPIIDRNTTIPISRVKLVSTLLPNQTELKVEIYQGEGRRIEENLRIGEFEVKGIPRGRPASRSRSASPTTSTACSRSRPRWWRPSGSSPTSSPATPRGWLPRMRSSGPSRRWRRSRPGLARRPINRHLLRRAERLFGEIGADHRTILGQFLDGFETALELGDLGAIERHREALKQLPRRSRPGLRRRREGGPTDAPW